MSDDMNEKLSSAIAERLELSGTEEHEILTRAQQKLKDTDEEVQAYQSEKNKVDARIASTKENILKLQSLLAQDEINSKELGVLIRAGLKEIDSLRQDEVSLP